jgi:hypothetical protein
MPYRFRKSLNKSGRKAFDNMFDIPHLYKEHNSYYLKGPLLSNKKHKVNRMSTDVRSSERDLLISGKKLVAASSMSVYQIFPMTLAQSIILILTIPYEKHILLHFLSFILVCIEDPCRIFCQFP